MTQLWTEKYRPKTIDEYVFIDDKQEEIVRHWIEQQHIPNLLFSGPPGTGKTSLALLLLNELNVEPGDIFPLNASKERGIDTVKEKISRFASTMPLGEYKYILLDEADFLTKQAQMPLRNMIETYNEFTRFILTCNYPHMIDAALHSRLEHFHISALNEEQFTLRVINILWEEGVDFDEEDLANYVTVTYPDLRACIKLLQSNSVGGKLRPSSNASNFEKDFMIEAVNLFKAGKLQEARKLLTSKATPNDYRDIYKILYRNLDWWSDDPETQQKAILKIAEGVRWNDNCADQEINLAATLVELELL